MRVVLCVAIVVVLVVLTGTAQADTITLTDFRAVMTSSVDPLSGNTVVSLRVNPTLFGIGGFAGGLFNPPPDDTQPPPDDNNPPPDDGIWLADPGLSHPPEPGTVAVSFLVDSGGTVMGIQPEPFRLFLAKPPPDDGSPATLIGELDFSDVGGTLGSLHLTGVKVWALNADGTRTDSAFDVAPFTIQNVPEPSTLVLFGLGVAGLAVVRRRRSGR